MDIHVLTLFPEMVQGASGFGVIGRALEGGLADVRVSNPRAYTTDVHQTVDDRPYGGGPGMVLKYEPMAAAIDAARETLPAGSPVVFLSPQGRVFDQQQACRFAGFPGMLLVAGRYEGFDERLLEACADEEVSLGDYVISGGEMAALVVMDAVMRLLPGVLGDETSAQQDSFVDGLLDFPHYTRPDSVAGMQVPEVLQSGNHAAIRRWRLQQALGRTWLRRPDLLQGKQLNAEEQQLLDEFIAARRKADGQG